MRLVVDTNVFVSAALKASSWPAHTIRWISRYGGLLKSDPTEQELLAVLQRPRFADKLPPWFLPDVRRMPAAALRERAAGSLLAMRPVDLPAERCNGLVERDIRLAAQGARSAF